MGSEGPAQERPWGESLSCCCRFAGSLVSAVVISALSVARDANAEDELIVMAKTCCTLS
jgi:hypothetical protein